MPVQITSPSVSVSSRIKDIRNRGIDKITTNNSNYNLNSKRYTLSSSVPSLPHIDIENGNISQNKFENECNLKNKVSIITKKFDTPSNDTQFIAQQFKSKVQRREIFSSNRNISLSDNRERCNKLTKTPSELGDSWSKLGSFIKNSIYEEKIESKKDIYKLSLEKTPEKENFINSKHLENRLSISSKASISSSNIHSIRSSSSSVTVSGSSICAINSTPSSSNCCSPNSSTKDRNMPFKIRSSKYRHVYGIGHKEDVCYKNIKITKNAAHDSAFCAVNPKFVAIVTEECGGGAFVVLPIKQTGRVDINTPKITGHRGPVLDLKWNPFNDNEIASCSEDATIKVWQIDDFGLSENLNEWVVDLHGHQRKVSLIEWHPTAENIMISSGADCQLIIWNLEKAEPIRILTCHSDIIQSMSWSRDGSLFVTTCKDKKIRIIDPRNGVIVKQCDGHQGSKISKVIYLGCGTKLFTTGFSKLSERQIALWDINDLSKPIQIEIVDCSSGVLIPFYDHDTKIVYVAGKGDGNIRYYEITDTDPYIHFLSEYKSSTPQRGLGVMPKRGLDVTKNEIYRFYKLHTTGNLCEPISMVVPRKSEVFQEDIYPETLSGIPSISCEEWIAGENREPILISLKDGAVSFMPKIVTYKQVGYSRLGANYNHSFPNKKENSSKIHMQNISRTNSISTVSSNKKNNSCYDDDHNTIPMIELRSITKLNSNGRSAFQSYKSCSQQPNTLTSPSSQIAVNQIKPNSDSVCDSFSAHFNNNNISYNTEDLTLEAMVHANLIDGMSPNESVSLFQDSDSICSFRSISKQNNDLEASYVTSMSKNPITLRKTESLKLDSVQSLRNRFNRISTNNLSTLTRKNSKKTETKLKSTELNKSVNNSLENIPNKVIGENDEIDNETNPTLNNLHTTSPSNLAQTDSSGSPNQLITSTASLSSSSSLSNTAILTMPNGNEPHIQTNLCSVKKRVWTPVTQSNSLNHVKQNDFKCGSVPSNFSELQRSYFRLKDQLTTAEKQNKSLIDELAIKEISFKELVQELKNKDKRIDALENKLNFYLINSATKIDSTSDILHLIADSDC